MRRDVLLYNGLAMLISIALDLIVGAKSVTYVLAGISVIVIVPSLIHVLGSTIHLIGHLLSHARFFVMLILIALVVLLVEYRTAFQRDVIDKISW